MESWSICPEDYDWCQRVSGNNSQSYDAYKKEYENLISTFEPAEFNPDKWADAARQTGMKYVVFITKHHDGFALWNTGYGNLNAVKHSAAGRDVLTSFIDGIHKRELKVGIYFSLPDWSYGDYTQYTKTITRYKPEKEPDRWGKFLDYYQGQLSKLSEDYDPDLWWFDGDWEHSDEDWQVDKVRSMLLKKNPGVILNSRLRGKGDYETPEQGPPVVRPVAKYWELCLTMNDSWGYQHNDTNYKSPQQTIDIFADCISKGGNLLLDIGPKADGTIPEEQEHILKELGRWTDKHKEAIYGTERGIPYDHYYGPTALS